MADSDDEYDRKRRDKFRGERSSGDSYRSERRDDRRGGGAGGASGRDEWAERNPFRAGGAAGAGGGGGGRPRPDYRDYRGPRDRFGSPGREMPPTKRMRPDWGDEMRGNPRFGGYDPYLMHAWNEHYAHSLHSAYGGHVGSHVPPARETMPPIGGDLQTQPALLTLKQFLDTQDDGISDSEVLRKYTEYKLEFKRQQLNEFFVTHKDEEWFKNKYHPVDSVRRKDEQFGFLQNRVAVFNDLLDGGTLKGITIDTTQTDPLIRLLDTAVIKLEGGTDDDLKVLDEKPKDIIFPDRTITKVDKNNDDDVIITSVETKVVNVLPIVVDHGPVVVSPRRAQKPVSDDGENWDLDDDDAETEVAAAPKELIKKVEEPDKKKTKVKKLTKRKRTTSDSSDSSSSDSDSSSDSSEEEDDDDDDDEKVKDKYDLECVKSEEIEMKSKSEIKEEEEDDDDGSRAGDGGGGGDDDDDEEETTVKENTAKALKSNGADKNNGLMVDAADTEKLEKRIEDIEKDMVVVDDGGSKDVDGIKTLDVKEEGSNDKADTSLDSKIDDEEDIEMKGVSANAAAATTDAAAEVVDTTAAAVATAASTNEVDTKTTSVNGDDDQTETIDLDKVKDGPQPRALHRTSSIFLRNLAPAITKAEIETVCQRFSGYLRVAIADPLVERRWYRRGWVTFQRDVNIKEICWNLNNTRLRDCEMGAIVNRDLSRRVRPTNGITAHKTIVRADIKLCAKIAMNLDEKFKLWQNSISDGSMNDADKTNCDDETAGRQQQQQQQQKQQDQNSNSDFYGFKTNNPVLQNITDFLIEEASAEEEELLGISGEHKDGDGEVIERDEQLISVLDRLILYLRIVHSVDYYNHCEYPYEDEMPNRCGIIHARGPPPSKINPNDLQEYIKNFENKMKQFLTKTTTIDDEELKNLGCKNADSEVEKFIQANTQELAKDKWLCPLSGKKFKGPEFIRKHIFNKHVEKVDEVKKEVEFFNNYLKDPKRPQLPEHPGSSRRTNSESGGGGGGYRPPLYPPSFGGPPYGGFAPPMMMGGRGGGRGFGGGRRELPLDHQRRIIGYHDLDAPANFDMFD